MMKSILFLVVLVIGLFTDTQAQFSGGDGSEGNPYQMATAADLNHVRNHLGSYFIQAADIDLDVAPFNTGSGWEPVGTFWSPFTGTFDGNGFTISNLYINRGSENEIGLFGLTSGAVIKNTGLTNVDVTGGRSTGGLVGLNEGSTITHSYAAGTVSGGDHTGGLVGGNGNSSTVTSSYAAGTVSGGSYTGGLVGYNNNATVTNSYWNTETSGQAGSAGGTGFTMAQMKQKASFTGFDFNSTWGIDEGFSYPYLQNNVPSSMPEHPFAGGAGTETDPLQIAEAGQLNLIRDYLDKHFILTADIDLDAVPFNTGSGWEPVGGTILSFTGTFNGNGFTIFNLYINRSSENYIGLFGHTYGAAISNTGLTNVDVTGGYATGGLVGVNNVSSAITDSYAAGTVSGGNETGGLVGANYNGSTVTSSYAAGTVSGGNKTGGLVGYNSLATITNSYAAGMVSGSSDTGGLVGYNYSATITNSYWNTETSSQAASAGGTGLTTAQMKDSANYAAGWDFVNTWGISQNAMFPWLQETGAHRSGGPEIAGSEGWRIITSPFGDISYGSLLDSLWTQGFTGSDSPDEGAPNVYTWSESGGWTALPDAANVPGAGTGFIVYVYDDHNYDGIPGGFPKSLFIEGKEDTGPVSPALSFTDTEDLPNDGWNLVGNPYATTIDWDARTGWTTSNLDASFYIWNAAAGAYQSWNGESGTLSNGLIAPWQGFWVKANAAEPTISFSDDIRSAGGIFQKEKPTLSISFELASEDKSSSAVVMLSKEAQIGNDHLDAFKLQSLTTDYLSLFTQLEDGSALDINALPTNLEESLTIPLNIDGSDLAGALELSWNSEALPEDWKFVLKDHQTGEEFDLRKSSALTFQLSANKQASETKEKNPPQNPVHKVMSPKVMTAKSGEISRFILTVTSPQAVTNERQNEMPDKMDLQQNYPNPFNPYTVISYQLPVNSAVRLEVFDLIGRKISTLVDEQIKAGTHQVSFDARNLASGMYIYRLEAGNKVFTKKLTLIK